MIPLSAVSIPAMKVRQKIDFLTRPIWLLTAVTALVGSIFSVLDIGAPLTLQHHDALHRVGIIAALLFGCCVWWGIHMQRRAVRAEHTLGTYRRYNTQLEDGMAVWFCDNKLISATYDVKAMFSLKRGFTLEQSLDAVCEKFLTEDAQTLRENIIELQNEGRSFRLWLPMFDKSVVIVSGRPEGGAFVIRFVNATEEAQEVAQLAARTETTSFEYQQMMQMHDISPVLMWRRTQSLRLSWVNAAYAKALKVNARDVILEQYELSLGQLGSKGAIELARHAYNTQTTQNERRQVILKDGKRILNVYEIPCADGTMGYALDVTQTVETQNTLAHQQDEYGYTLNQLNTGVALFDESRQLQFFNKTLSKLLQLNQDWLKRKPHHSEIIDRLRQRRRLPEWPDFRAWRQSVMELYTGAKTAHDETWHLSDGTILHVAYKARHAGGIMILIEDETDKITLERQYNTLLGLRKATFEQLSEGLIVFGMDGYMQFANIAFSTIWNLDPERLESRPHVSEIIEWCQPMYSNQEDWQNIQNTITTSGARGSWHDFIRCNNGCTLEASISPLPDGSMMLSFRDVTDAQNIENALLEKTSALEAADNLKTEFMGHISYQLRTPLNTVLGFGEILQREMSGPLNKKQHEYIEGILSSSSILLRIVNDILDLSSIEAGTFNLDIRQVDIRRMLSSLSDLVIHRMREKDIKFILNCPEGIGAIPGDENRIRQMFFRLIQNALKHTQEGGSIELGCCRDQNTVKMWVKDTGTGMSDEQLKTVFDTFNGIKRLAHNRYTGIGIGLTLVKKFIELHNGTIQIQSQENEGTQVYCTFPAVQANLNALEDNTQNMTANPEDDHSLR